MNEGDCHPLASSCLKLKMKTREKEERVFGRTDYIGCPEVSPI